jgi:hypothetical protein
MKMFEDDQNADHAGGNHPDRVQDGDQNIIVAVSNKNENRAEKNYPRREIKDRNEFHFFHSLKEPCGEHKITDDVAEREEIQPKIDAEFFYRSDQ